jgi:hypothetical protein
MNHSALGRLAKIELRKVWTSEPGGFTPWLAKEENLSLLGDAIDVELELSSQEQPVGPFRADILCKDTSNDDWVLIENQLERTDHTHLGQLLTYAAGLEAVTIVWVAQRFTEEHRAALDWLNERTDDHVNFFGLEIELWQIGDSPIAPKFNVVCKPNGWTRSVRESATGEVSGHKELQRRFWTGLRDYLKESGSRLRCGEPPAQHWFNHPIGRSGFHLSSCASGGYSPNAKRAAEIRAELVLDGKQSKRNFSDLSKRRAELENALGFSLEWHNPEAKAMCRIYVRREADFTDERLWKDQFRWLKERQEAMLRVFAPAVQQLSDSNEPEA